MGIDNDAKGIYGWYITDHTYQELVEWYNTNIFPHIEIDVDEAFGGEVDPIVATSPYFDASYEDMDYYICLIEFSAESLETFTSFDISTFWDGLRNDTQIPNYDEKIKMLIGDNTPPRLYATPHIL
jgi:hypothetical protein